MKEIEDKVVALMDDLMQELDLVGSDALAEKYGLMDPHQKVWMMAMLMEKHELSFTSFIVEENGEI